MGKIKFQIDEDRLTFSKGKGKLSVPLDDDDVCNICGMEGIDDDHDIYDCVEHDEQKRGVPKGTWMVDWMKRLKEKEKKKKSQGGFKEWSSKH